MAYRDFVDTLMMGSSGADAGQSATRKENALVSSSQQEGASDPAPSYADGVRAVLDILDKHRVDIEKALCYGRNSHTYNDVCKKVIEGELIFIPLADSVMLCEVSHLPQFSTFHCFVAAGDLDELLTEGTTQLGIAAQAYGCKHISMAGRRGWEPVLKKQGWVAPLTGMYKEVTHELR